jgi:hypothetical protein
MLGCIFSEVAYTLAVNIRARKKRLLESWMGQLRHAGQIHIQASDYLRGARAGRKATEMEPILVVYARGGVDDIINVLCEASEDLEQTLWSLGGNPCSMRPFRPAIAIRSCIIDAKKVDPHQIPEDKVLGTVHVVRVPHVPSKYRVSFYSEDLSGESLSSASEGSLRLFCNYFSRLLEAKDIKVEARPDELETAPFSLPPLVQNDTGPLAS